MKWLAMNKYKIMHFIHMHIITYRCIIHSIYTYRLFQYINKQIVSINVTTIMIQLKVAKNAANKKAIKQLVRIINLKLTNFILRRGCF